jgi:hypothetical protein
MARIPLDLIPEDFRRGRRRNPRSCLLERALERQYGGKWHVGLDARQRGVMWPRVWSLGDDAVQAMAQFDAAAPMSEIFRGRRTLRVTLRGKPLSPAQRREPSRGRSRARPPQRREPSRGRSRARSPQRRRVPRRALAIASTAAAGSLILIGDGLAWVVVAAAVAAAAVLAAIAGIRVRHALGARAAVMPGRTASDAEMPARTWRSGAPEQVPVPAVPYPVSWPQDRAETGEPLPGSRLRDDGSIAAASRASWPREPAMTRDAAPWRHVADVEGLAREIRDGG